MITWFLVGCTVFVTWLISSLFLGRKKNYPPGPTPYPVVGSLHHLRNNATANFDQLSKKYGNIFSLRLGTVDSIVLNSYELVRDAFKDDRFNGRPSNLFFKIRNEGNNGILFADGPAYQEMRRFTLRHLRDFGFGKTSLESSVGDEIRQLEENLKRYDGQSVNLQNKFNLSVLNALWAITSGERFSLDDARAMSVIETLTKVIQAGGPTDPGRFIPILNYLPGTKQAMSDKVALVSSVKELLNETIERHRQSEHKDDFISVFLKHGAESDPSSPFHGDRGLVQLRIVLLDLFVAGAETTSTTLTWFFLLIAAHPEIQTKVHAELDLVVGRDRKPNLDDRPSLKYTEACIQETLRFVSLVGMVSHRATETVEFHGYTIPADTAIIANIHSALHDPAIWERPDTFYPEHFLNGKTPEGYIPFGVGKRACLGESLAKMELFLFVTHLLHSFVFSAREGDSLSLEPANQNSLVRSPKPYKVVIKSRF